MGTRSWGPGTSRWIYLASLITASFVICLAIAIPLAIDVNSETMWAALALLATSGVTSITAVWGLHKLARRTSTSASGPAPHH
jgi:hypothetical protein